jgi:uncharacterized membrane protein
MSQEPGEFPQHMFEAAVEFAVLAIRTLVLVNGAAVIALLTFVGQVWANDQHNGSAMAHILFWPLMFFLLGLVLAVVTTLLAYLTQMLTTEHGGGVIPPVSKTLHSGLALHPVCNHILGQRLVAVVGFRT